VYKEQTDVSNDDSAGPMFSGWQGYEPSPPPLNVALQERRKDRIWEQKSASNEESTKALSSICIDNLLHLS